MTQKHGKAQGLATVVLIGWLVERFVFDTVERLTVRRWGVQR